VGEAENGLEAVAMIDEHEPDLVFLDVQMPGLDGLSVAREVIERGGKLPHFVFVTAFDQYAVEAFEVNAADYLLKPIEKARLERTLERTRKAQAAPDLETVRVERLLAQLQGQSRPPAKLLVRKGESMVLVDAGDVVYATTEGGAITVATISVQGVSNYRTIEELQQHLDPNLFWRAHRSYLVNIDRIQEVVPWFKSTYQLRMADKAQTEIPVSRAQTKRLRELFKL
jgi:two-component system LytT family response regulator/two-component system response regulator LytT